MIRTVSIAAVAVCITIYTSAQQNPLSLRTAEELQILECIDLGSPDMGLVYEEDRLQEESGGMENFGRILFTDLNAAENGIWEVLPDGSRVWRILLKSPGALGCAIYLDEMRLPEGSALYVYDPDYVVVDGPYTKAQEDVHGRFATGTVYGEEILLEFNQPAPAVGESLADPVIRLYGFAHFYRHIFDEYAMYQEVLADNLVAETRGGGAGACQVDVNCPEGNNWQEQKDAVVRLQIADGQFVGLCSGVLMNTTARDCRQYLLSALHCALGVSDGDLAFLQVRFNYEKPLCGSGFFPQNRNVTGVTHLADSNDGGGDSGSDFVLFEIEDEIPDSWEPFFAGWRSTTAGSSSGVSIHHPSGDVKKISTYTSSLQSVWLGAPGSHWQVTWAPTATEHGVTEGGSSGSPIFDSNKRVIGTLTGGNSFCNDPFEPDYYGKMSYHWSNNPNAANQKLREWLDPISTDETAMDGSYRPCDQGVSIREEAGLADVDAYPNPTNGQVTLRSEAGIVSVEVYDASGRLVKSAVPSAFRPVLDLTTLNAGVYFLQIALSDGSNVIRQVQRY